MLEESKGSYGQRGTCPEMDFLHFIGPQKPVVSQV